MRETRRKTHNTRYPNIEPPREGNISSPLPMVTEAIMAPGPKKRNHRKGLWESKAEGGVRSSAFSMLTLQDSLILVQPSRSNTSAVLIEVASSVKSLGHLRSNLS